MATAIIGAGLLSLTTASAEEPGVVRISDGVTRTAAQSDLKLPPAPLPSELSDAGTVYTPGMQPIPEGTYIESYGCQNCPPGDGYYGQDCHGHNCVFGGTLTHRGDRCQDPNCPHCNNGRGRASCWGRNALPPDYGFHPPTPEPFIWRQPVVYQRYLPDQPYGTPGMTYTQAVQPMVYMPTDTTQLGFNYMHVPQWLPNRANYPLAPNPVMWQRRVAPYDNMYDNQYRAKHKSFHFGRNENDLMQGGPVYLPYQKSKKDDDDENQIEGIIIPKPAPAIEASLETDAQI